MSERKMTRKQALAEAQRRWGFMAVVFCSRSAGHSTNRVYCYRVCAREGDVRGSALRSYRAAFADASRRETR